MEELVQCCQKLEDRQRRLQQVAPQCGVPLLSEADGPGNPEASVTSRKGANSSRRAVSSETLDRSGSGGPFGDMLGQQRQSQRLQRSPYSAETLGARSARSSATGTPGAWRPTFASPSASTLGAGLREVDRYTMHSDDGQPEQEQKGDFDDYDDRDYVHDHALAAVQASTRAACWQQSLAALRQTSSPPVVLFNACAASCSKGRQWGAAILLAEEIHCLGLEATVVTCNTRIKAAGSGEMNWASTLDFLRAAQKQSLRSDAVTWNSAADACTGQGAPGVWPQALQLLEGLSWRGLETDGVTATLRIKSASWPAAMLQLSHPAESFSGKAAKVGVSAGLSSLALGTAWSYGVSLLHTMRNRAVELDQMALTAAIALYSGEEASDAWMGALRLLGNIHAPGLDQGTSRKAARVDKVAISSAMTVCTNHQLWERALSLFEALLEARRADVVSFGSAISAAASGRLWELALHLHEEMPKMQLAPNQVTFNAVIDACEQGLQWEVAVSMMPSMKLLRITPDVVSYTSTISACGQAQRWLDAIHLLGEALHLRLRTNIMSLSSAI
ncbi:unnamed protein product, partial [Symbiodinium necroappetens]